jgi:hypothetical protein
MKSILGGDKPVRTTHASGSILTALILAVLTVVPAAVWSQVKKGTETTPAPPKSKTKLEVDGGVRGMGGESLAIHSPEVLAFRWSTDQEGVAYAFWEVFDAPFSPADTVVTAQASHLVSSEQVGTAKRGLVASFAINFDHFANQTPPESPKRYYVRVVTKNGQGQPVGLPSPPVVITYSRPPGWKPPELGSEYCYLSVQNPYHLDRCSLKFVNFYVVDPTLNRVDVSPNHSLLVLIKSAVAGKKYQVDCKLDASGAKHTPYEISGPGIYTESVPQTGGMTHAIFIFESKNTEWVMFKIKNEEPMMFFNCKVTNLK